LAVGSARVAVGRRVSLLQRAPRLPRLVRGDADLEALRVPGHVLGGVRKARDVVGRQRVDALIEGRRPSRGGGGGGRGWRGGADRDVTGQRAVAGDGDRHLHRVIAAGEVLDVAGPLAGDAGGQGRGRGGAAGRVGRADARLAADVAGRARTRQ